MCYSFETSILAYSSAFITFLLMNKRNLKYDKFVKYLILAYSLVQIGEAIIWSSKVLPNKKNILGTNIVFIGLAIQALAVGYAAYKNNKNKYLLVLGLVVSLYFILSMKVKPSKIIDNNIVWGFNSKFYIVIYLVLFFILFISKLDKLYTLILFLWFSIIGFYYIFYKKYRGSSSLWCYMSSLLTPLLYFVPNIFGKK